MKLKTFKYISWCIDVVYNPSEVREPPASPACTDLFGFVKTNVFYVTLSIQKHFERLAADHHVLCNNDFISSSLLSYI